MAFDFFCNAVQIPLGHDQESGFCQWPSTSWFRMVENQVCIRICHANAAFVTCVRTCGVGAVWVRLCKPQHRAIVVGTIASVDEFSVRASNNSVPQCNPTARAAQQAYNCERNE
jgi:hypothetical protein